MSRVPLRSATQSADLTASPKTPEMFEKCVFNYVTEPQGEKREGDYKKKKALDLFSARDPTALGKFFIPALMLECLKDRKTTQLTSGWVAAPSGRPA